jgi:hypothetical protein
MYRDLLITLKISSVVMSFFDDSISEIGYFDDQRSDGNGVTLESDTVRGDDRVCGAGESLLSCFISLINLYFNYEY